VFLGIENLEKGMGIDHHNPHFDIDEDVLKLGVATTVQYTYDFLNSDKSIHFSTEEKDLSEVLKGL
jgi:metal-dependent amidase/aminoacylase/carboxypeptidase family protein